MPLIYEMFEKIVVLSIFIIECRADTPRPDLINSLRPSDAYMRQWTNHH